MSEFKKLYRKREEPKAQYQVRHWAEYNKTLVNRGAL
jgi:hypothetical protein